MQSRTGSTTRLTLGIISILPAVLALSGPPAAFLPLATPQVRSRTGGSWRCLEASAGAYKHAQAHQQAHAGEASSLLPSTASRVVFAVPESRHSRPRTTLLCAGADVGESDDASSKGKVSTIGVVLLALTIALEVAGATCMKLSNNFANPVPSVLLFLFYGSSFTLFTYALKHWQLSVAYAIWSGVGTAATAAIGILVFGELLRLKHFIGLTLIIAGVVLMNF